MFHEFLFSPGQEVARVREVNTYAGKGCIYPRKYIVMECTLDSAGTTYGLASADSPRCLACRESERGLVAWSDVPAAIIKNLQDTIDAVRQDKLVETTQSAADGDQLRDSVCGGR